MHKHHLFLKWLISIVLILFGFGAAFYFGLAQLVLMSDISLISAGILVIFILVSLYIGVQIINVSKEIELSLKIQELLETSDLNNLNISLNKMNRLIISDTEIPDGLLPKHIKNIIRKYQVNPNDNIDQTLLLQEYSESLHDKGVVGWLTSSKLTNLGLLGTAIGFVLALSALFGITTLDVSIMKTVLSNVSIGMAVALYTTIAALVTSIPLEIQTYFLERGNNKLISIATQVTEIYVIPSLKRNKTGE